MRMGCLSERKEIGLLVGKGVWKGLIQGHEWDNNVYRGRFDRGMDGV